MKELLEEFNGRGEVSGHLFKQIEKTLKGYIYSVEEFGNINYEVFKRVENLRFDCVSYPTSNGFGTWAWTTSNLEKAKEILNSF